MINGALGAGWGDFNNDGVLDLYVAHYVNWSFANHPNCPGQPMSEGYLSSEVP